MRILTAKILLKSVRIILECYIEETCKSHFFIRTDKCLVTYVAIIRNALYQLLYEMLEIVIFLQYFRCNFSIVII